MNIVVEIKKKWKARPKTSHKGDFGRVFILAGSKGLAGAAHLAGMGALRAGAGLVTVGVPEKIYPVVARREAELMVKPFPSTRQGTLALKGAGDIQDFLRKQDVLALGPGLSQNHETQQLIRHLLPKVSIPMVIDADGLNALVGHPEIFRRCQADMILTPHPGEFLRLFGPVIRRSSPRKRGSPLPPQSWWIRPSAEKACGDDGLFRRQSAEEVAKRYGIILVLKGHHTVIASPDGKVGVNPTGNPGMATAGTGDVLTGAIAALVGQKFSLWDAARFGVFFHGLAGDLAAGKMGQVSLTAGDVLNFFPGAFKKVLNY